MWRRFRRIGFVLIVVLIVAPQAAWAPLWGHTIEYCEDDTFSTVVGTFNFATPACPDRPANEGMTSEYRIYYVYSSCYQQAPFSYDTWECQHRVGGVWQQVSCGS
jgi:hypothetical protein